MAFPLSGNLVPIYLTILLSWAIAAFLLKIDFHKAAHRTFAAYLFLSGLQLLIVMLRSAGTTAAEIEYWQRLAPYVVIPRIPALIYFAAVYPKRRTWLGTSATGGWLLFGLALALEVLYAIDHELFWTVVPGSRAGEFLAAGPGYHYEAFGPLVLLQSLVPVVAALVGLRFLFDAAADQTKTTSYSAFLVFAGLELNALFFGTLQSISLYELVVGGTDYPWLPWGWAFAILPATALLVALIALVPAARFAFNSKVEVLDREAKGLVLLAPVPVACGIGLHFAGPESAVLGDPVAVFVLGVWRLALPVLVCYALLRYHVFDADLKIKWGIQQGTVLAVLGAIFFGVSEGVEALVSRNWGQWSGLGAAALMAVAIRPLEGLGQRVAGRVMPNTKPIHELDDDARKRLYWDQFSMAVQDGQLTSKERRMLMTLQRRLGLPGEPLLRQPGRSGGRRGSAAAR